MGEEEMEGKKEIRSMIKQNGTDGHGARIKMG